MQVRRTHLQYAHHHDLAGRPYRRRVNVLGNCLTHLPMPLGIRATWRNIKQYRTGLRSPRDHNVTCSTQLPVGDASIGPPIDSGSPAKPIFIGTRSAGILPGPQHRHRINMNSVTVDFVVCSDRRDVFKLDAQKPRSLPTGSVFNHRYDCSNSSYFDVRCIPNT